MSEKLHVYRGTALNVMYDKGRCIRFLDVAADRLRD